MEEKEYPVFEEEEHAGLACDPVSNATAELRHKYEDTTDDDIDWDRISLGPFSEEEAIARIDKFEDDLANGRVKWFSSKESWKRLYNKYPWLR